MKEKRRNIPVYSDGRVRLNTTLTVQVDNAGDEWLTPEQIVYLENEHLWAHYAFNHAFKPTKRLVKLFELPVPEVQDATASTVDRRFIRPTPAFNGATI